MDWTQVLPAAGVGLAGGTLVGLTGVGAGSVIAALLLVFYPTVSPQTIVGTATVQAIAMKFVGVWARQPFRLDERRLGLSMAAGAIPLAVAGAWVSSRLDATALRPVVSFVLLVVGGTLVVQAARARTRGRASRAEEAPAPGSEPDPPARQTGLIGAAVGFVAGLTSVGTGTLFVSALAGALRVGSHRAVAAALLAGFLTLLVSGATHLVLGHVDGALVVGTCLGSIPGVLVGTARSHRLHPRTLRGLIGAGIMLAAFVALARLTR
jgi:uncharacterized membrane protein YfcA